MVWSFWLFQMIVEVMEEDNKADILEQRMGGDESRISKRYGFLWTELSTSFLYSHAFHILFSYEIDKLQKETYDLKIKLSLYYKIIL